MTFFYKGVITGGDLPDRGFIYSPVTKGMLAKRPRAQVQKEKQKIGVLHLRYGGVNKGPNWQCPPRNVPPIERTDGGGRYV